MSSELPVLIVGAGPTGLTMACELARHGVSFRIIDKKSEPTVASNATWIQPRTLEMLTQMNLVDRFLKLGHSCKTITLYVEGKIVGKISFNNINSFYQFILMLPQSETERLLTARLAELSRDIERSTELIDIRQDKKVTAILRHENGMLESVTTDWLIACDGANSTVREKCHVSFPGEDLSEQFMVADAQMDSFLSQEEIHLFFDEGTLLAASPMGNKKYRLAANLHVDVPRKTFIKKEVIETVQERAHGEFYVTDISWISPFWIHSKAVKKIQFNAIFLAGDAAHTHSPAGGQGMNTGMQDAYNLAWKLALVIRGHAKPTILESYQLERHPIIINMVNETEKLTLFALSGKPFLKKLKKFAATLKLKRANYIEKITSHISQLNICYNKSPIIAKRKRFNTKSPMPGERAPNAIIAKTTQLYDYLHTTQHNLLVFINPITKQKFEHIIEVQNQLKQTFTNLINVWIVTTKQIKDVENVIVDEQGLAFNAYGIKKQAVYIVRPDSYIAFSAKELNFNEIKRFLKRYLIIK